jgi:creatinine amidohydrolase/Fe(II)-dependent formamide hydrolase-like protein
MEAEEAFKRSDTAILPVGTLHGHGPTPISIDSSSVAWLADKVGERTGLVTLPLIPFGENDKQKFYPGSIAIAPDTLERFYLDVFRSLYRNGVRRIIALNGHGGNRETLIRAGRAARDLGVVVAIPEWWSIGKEILPELHPEKGSYLQELAVSLYLGGKDAADLRDTGYKGEWGGEVHHEGRPRRRDQARHLQQVRVQGRHHHHPRPGLGPRRGGPPEAGEGGSG